MGKRGSVSREYFSLVKVLAVADMGGLPKIQVEHSGFLR